MRYLPTLLESIARQTLDKSQYEIIIINNNSPDNTDEVCEEFHKKYPDIQYKYFVETKQGLSHARNRGIAEANGWLLTFIDDDTYLDENFLEVYVAEHEKQPDVWASGGKVSLFYEAEKPAWLNRFLSELLGYFDMGNESKFFARGQYPRGMNMTFRHEVFDTYGAFDPNLGRNKSNLNGGEEKDMFARIMKDRKALYVPGALVYHAVPLSRTKSDFIKQQALWVGRSVRYMTKGKASKTLTSLFIEGVKWGVSLGLFFAYSLVGRAAAGIMIVRFRWWVSTGFFSKPE